MIKPNFLIPGAGRSGTTTLYEYLKQHPSIYMSEVKEPSYFSINYNLGKKWYLKKFLETKNEKAIGEASTSYMYIEKAAERIYNFNPNIKFIFMLRDPVKRAYSNYKREVQKWGRTESFELLIKESKRYTEPGLYYKHIKRFLDYFPKENMLFIIFEEFIENEEKELKKICNFLSVDDAFYFDKEKINLNQSKAPISLNFQKLINRYLKYNLGDSYFKKAFKFNCERIFSAINHSIKIRDFSTLKEETKEFLKKKYEKDTEKLKEIIDNDLDCWS